jgi:hypothetical protein
MSTKNNRPVQDSGASKPAVPFRAGGKNQGDLATRKAALSDTGSIGHVPGHRGTGYGSSAQAGHVHEAPVTPSGDDELEAARRPMPREIAVQSQTTHFGNITRYLDGHSEIHRDRPGLVELLGNPHVHPDDKEAIQMEITHRDAIHNHRYW